VAHGRVRAISCNRQGRHRHFKTKAEARHNRTQRRAHKVEDHRWWGGAIVLNLRQKHDRIGPRGWLIGEEGLRSTGVHVGGVDGGFRLEGQSHGGSNQSMVTVGDL
jgi:hypothetical protein